jgi:membrane protease YdiL (CAAX protease family)
MQQKPSMLAFFTAWAVLALAALYPVARFLRAAFPILTVLWIALPLVVVWRGRDPELVGFRKVAWPVLLRTTAINVGGLLLIMLAVEPWSHTYRMLLDLALAGRSPDSTFAWLLRFSRVPGLGAMALYSGLVTLFGEELFFRGWLLQVLQKRMRTRWAVLTQAALFMLPNLLAALALPELQGWLYALVYSWLAIGVVGGWAAARTKSVWPSLISATLCNLLLVALII